THAQTGRSFLDQSVAERVAERIVDELEAIEIEEQQGHRLAVALRVVERVGEALVEHVTVGQSRQGVVRRDVQEVLLGLLAGHELADLAADHAHHLQQRRIGIADLAAEEFQYGEGDVARKDRKGERAVEPRPGGELLPLEALVAAYVRYPVRRAAHPLRYLAGSVADDAAFRLDVADAPVLEDETELGPPPHAGFDRLAEVRLDALAILGVDLPE